MVFWSGERLSTNTSVVKPFNADQIDCNAYNLRMGSTYFRTADSDEAATSKKVKLAEKESFAIPSGQFAFLLSKEEVSIPKNAFALISMRTSIKFQGLINVSGFHVEPGYTGKLIYAVFNAGPTSVNISEDQQLFKIWFCDLDSEPDSEHSSDKPGYQDIDNDIIRGMNAPILSLQTITAKLADQRSSVDFLNIVYKAMVGGVIIAIVLAVLLPVFHWVEFYLWNFVTLSQMFSSIVEQLARWFWQG